jgi:ABC-type sugar transport system ATPase subunit
MDQRPISSSAVVELRGIRKSYGHVEALRGVDLSVRAGEIVAIVGDNGAGKSTLIKVLTGVTQADAGEIMVEGRSVQISSPNDARDLGIAAIFQELELFDKLDVSENVFAGREITKSFCGVRWLARKEMLSEAERVVQRLGIRTLSSAKLRVGELSGGQRQMIAVARALGMNARVLVLDEPTAALGLRESATLLGQVEQLKDDGVGIILITHRIPDALAIADSIAVMKHGEVHAVLEPSNSSLEEIADVIVRGRRDALGDRREEEGSDVQDQEHSSAMRYLLRTRTKNEPDPQ